MHFDSQPPTLTFSHFSSNPNTSKQKQNQIVPKKSSVISIHTSLPQIPSTFICLRQTKRAIKYFHALAMKYLVKRRKQMSLKTELACLSLLVLILLQLETPSLAAGNEKSTRVKAAPTTTSEINPAKPQVGGFKRSAEKDGNDEIFGADKRTIYTGPNPLHNR